MTFLTRGLHPGLKTGRPSGAFGMRRKKVSKLKLAEEQIPRIGQLKDAFKILKILIPDKNYFRSVHSPCFTGSAPAPPVPHCGCTSLAHRIFRTNRPPKLEGKTRRG
ncbi:MAG: hypothetical protein WA004_12305, partial [Saprospiraceae bacterium]